MSSIEASTQIYREIHQDRADLLEWLDLRNQLYVVTDNKGKEHVFVDNDLPRDSDITPLIVENTVGFALFDDTGTYVASYRSLDKALDAQQGARIVVATDVDVEADEILDVQS